MKKIVSLNQLSDEELFKLLEESTEDNPSNEINDVTSFIHFFNLKPGRYKVRTRFLYSLYKDWSKIPIKHYPFVLELTKYLRNTQGFMYINKSCFTLLEKSHTLLEKKTRNKVKNKSYKTHFEYFISHYGLKSGKYYLESEILYHFYNKWCYENKTKNCLTFDNFIKFLNIYFRIPKVTRLYVYWFGFDKKSLINITEEEIERIRSSYEEKAKKSKRKT